MNLITLEPPIVEPRRMEFRWHVEPATPLYRRTSFALEFPESVDVGGLPTWLVWGIALLCLHAHWMFLRPCRVKLPVRLPASWPGFWTRFLEAQLYSLEAYRKRTVSGTQIEFEMDGAELMTAPAGDGACAAAFSGGKDSLLQAALLCECGEPPLLVTTTSPMPSLQDHVTTRRRQVLAEIVRRRPVKLVEVRSDFRSSWDNAFSHHLGYPAYVNEVTDTHLYTAALLAAGWAVGARRFFVASETEVQENIEWNGRTVFHPHMMYAAALHLPLGRLFGVRLSSLTWPLHSAQVQELLWRRYPDLRDLQYSCWKVTEDQAMCSACSQCLRLALGALAVGADPSVIGIDWPRLMRFAGKWKPRHVGVEGTLWPDESVRRELNSHVVRCIQQLSPQQVAAILGRQDRLTSLLYGALRWRVRRLKPGPPPGFRSGFVPLLDERCRAKVAKIYAEHFPEEPAAAHAEVVARTVRLADWILSS